MWVWLAPQFNTSVFCNPCDNNSNGTRNCNPLKCPLLQMAPQHTVTSFDQDSDTVRYFIVGGNNNNGQPAFQVDANTGALATSVLINYETGPRSYQLQVKCLTPCAQQSIAMACTPHCAGS